MPTTPDDDWPTDDPVLAAFAEDLRIVASGPAPEPRPGLVAAMRQGPIVPVGPRHERKRMPVKTFLGSLVAKLALGVGIATASVTAAGAAGVLPDAAQHAVSTVVDATTPFSIPDGSAVHAAELPDVDGSTTTTSSTVTSTTVATKGTDDGTDTESGDTGGTTGTHPDNHGACVSTAAHSDTSSTGENHGKAVSAVAKSDCGKSTSTTVSSTTTSSTTPTTIGGANSGATTNSGPGNSNGHGNSGTSNSGKSSSSKGGSGQD